MLISYAQNFEDVLLWRALKDVKKGLYIDVGAQDPVVDSVSRLFYDQGWRGIHVEATTTYANLLREARPDEMVFQVALSDVRGTMTFYEIPDTGISTGDPVIADRHKERGFQINETHVPTLRLEDIFAQAKGEVHWLKIDVEGMERQVLSGWGDAPVKPWIICVESTLPLTQTEAFGSWEGYLLDRGYEFVYFDGLNRYYISEDHPERRAAFVNGANIFDGFSLSGTASAPFSLHLLQRHAQETDKLNAFISGLNGRIAELEAEPVREDALRRQDEWIAQERSLNNTIAGLNARLLEIQQNHALSEKDAFAQISATKDALREAERARAEETARLGAERHALELQIAELNYDLRTERVTSADLQRAVTSGAAAIGQLEQRVQEAQDSFKSVEAQHVADRNQFAVSLAHERAALQSDINAFSARAAAAETQLNRAQEYIQALRASTSWRVTGPLRKLSVWLGSKPEGIPNFDTMPLPVTARQAQPSQLALNAPQAIADDLSEMRTGMTSNSHKIEPAQSLGELLVHCDERFVNCAYLTLLGRRPDLGGMAYYLDRVRSGDSKNQIVWELSQSEEGRLYGAKLPGLIKHRTLARRVAATLRKWLQSITGQAVVLRSLRVVENQTGLQAGIVAERIASLESLIATRVTNDAPQKPQEEMQNNIAISQINEVEETKQRELRAHSAEMAKLPERAVYMYNRLRSGAATGR